VSIDFFAHEHSIDTPGIVDFINQHGQLWVGLLSKDCFIQKFSQSYQNFLFSLKHFDQLEIKKHDSIKFQYNLTRHSLTHQWWSPVFLNNLDNWHVGNTRLLATGITKNNPWQHLKVLLISKSVPTGLEFLTKINTDEELKQHFIQPAGYQVLLGFSKSTQEDLQPAIFRKDLYKKNKPAEITDFFDDYLEWKKIYKNPTLKIYTNWPELIKDSQNIWHIEHSGPSLKINTLSNAYVEKFSRQFYADKVTEHCLIVNDPVKLDVSSFLCFADLTHTNYIDNDWKFLFFRPGSIEYKNTFIYIAECH
jgi:hypothetical protein